MHTFVEVSRAGGRSQGPPRRGAAPRSRWAGHDCLGRHDAVSRPALSLFFYVDRAFLFYIAGFDENIESQGELILQESFQVWDPKTLIRKGRERHLFLFEMSLVFSKEVKDSSGRSKYLYKSKLFVSIGVRNCQCKGNTTAAFL